MSEQATPVLPYAYHTPGTVPYRSPRGRATFAITMLSICLFGLLLSCGASFLQLRLLDRAIAGEVLSPAEYVLNEKRLAGVATGYMGVYIVSVVAFMMWIHRVYRNLSTFPVVKPQYTPGWAVGYYFIPILNLVRGYQVMHEIWLKSVPRARAGRSGTIVAIWWALLITSNISGTIADKLPVNDDDLNTYVASTIASMIDCVVTMLPAVVAIILVRRITQMQEETNAQPALQPPPLPVEAGVV